MRRRLAVLLGLWAMLGALPPPGARGQELRPPAAGFHHVHLNVVDPERSAAFGGRP